MSVKVLRVTTSSHLLRFTPKEVAALALGAREAELAEGLSRIVLVRVGLKLRPDQGFDFLHHITTTFAERHFTTASLGADSSVYIYNI